MFDDETQTRAALHTITDGPAPPITTTAEQVIRSGRRRVLLQRGGAVAAVIAAVAVIGVGATAFGGSTTFSPAGTTPTTPPPTTSSLTVPSTLETDFPDQNQSPPAGWTRVPATDTDGGKCESADEHPPGPHLALPPRSQVEDTVSTTLRELTGQAELTLVDAPWDEDADKPNGPFGRVAAEIPMGDGPGTVEVEVSSYAGTPVQAADRDIHSHSNCVGPSRRVLDDGTVLQLYPPMAVVADQPYQNVHAYLPGGRQYQVYAYGWAESGPPWGRGRIPLSPVQLGELVQRLVTQVG